MLACLLPLLSCVRTQTTVLPAEVLRHAEELRQTGQAHVRVSPSGFYLLRTDKVVEPYFEGGPLALSIGQLISDCPATSHSSPPPVSKESPVCLLDSTSSNALLLKTTRRADWEAIGTWAASGTLVGGVAYCGFECAYPWNGIVVF